LFLIQSSLLFESNPGRSGRTRVAPQPWPGDRAKPAPQPCGRMRVRVLTRRNGPEPRAPGQNPVREPEPRVRPGSDPLSGPNLRRTLEPGRATEIWPGYRSADRAGPRPPGRADLSVYATGSRESGCRPRLPCTNHSHSLAKGPSVAHPVLLNPEEDGGLLVA